MHYFLDARTPTGIQRVQMNVVTSILGQERQDVDVMIVCFTEKVDFWVEIPPETFLRICRLALWGGTTKDPVWRKTIDDLHVDLAIGDPVTFARGACLLNLGTSWWLQNYFLMVRYAKATHGVHYIPFVHDCIPVMAPEHCVRELTQDFITWLLGVFLHADGFLVNSKATGADLTNVGKFLGHSIAPPKSIYLDGADAASAEPPSALEAANASSVLADNNLERRPFVLFVSTIELRKNHLLAFNAWLKMIRKRGLANTPMLVCVGNAGWMVDAALGRLASSDLLKKKVVMLSKISDAELAALYRGCVFTIYPSSYEGWGLPVTESFCHGKAALIANTSSLPESGGIFADYFDLDSEKDFLAKLERLIDDRAYRAERERLIKTSFKPRTWGEIASQIIDAALEATKPIAAVEFARRPRRRSDLVSRGRNRRLSFFLAQYGNASLEKYVGGRGFSNRSRMEFLRRLGMLDEARTRRYRVQDSEQRDHFRRPIPDLFCAAWPPRELAGGKFPYRSGRRGRVRFE